MSRPAPRPPFYMPPVPVGVIVAEQVVHLDRGRVLTVRLEQQGPRLVCLVRVLGDPEQPPLLLPPHALGDLVVSLDRLRQVVGARR